MTTTVDKTCKDCGDALAEIRLIDKAHAYAHTDVEYTLPEAKRGSGLAASPWKESSCIHVPEVWPDFSFRIPKE